MLDWAGSHFPGMLGATPYSSGNSPFIYCKMDYV
jgi:hypothetical protein